MRVTNFDLSQWVEYTQQQHSRNIDLTLDRVTQVWQKLGAPQCQFNIVIAGTNGKGSSISMLEAVLLQAGKSVGTYTSPHLVRFNERIKVNGKETTNAQICQSFCDVEKARRDIPLTYFEFATLCALQIFSQHKIGIGLLEVGLGGRLDAVNIIQNDIALITSIGLDHEAWLGSDRECIGWEKAGVIKAQGKVVFAGQYRPNSIVEVAENRRATLIQSNRDYKVTVTNEAMNWSSSHPAILPAFQELKKIPLPYPGRYQLDNLAGVVAILGLCAERLQISPPHLFQGLRSAVIQGRCQIINHSPFTVVDVAHNEDSVQQLITFLDKYPCQGKRYAVFAALEDKALRNIISPMLKLIDYWHITSIKEVRGQTAEELANKLTAFISPMQISKFNTPTSAYQMAMQQAQEKDHIIIFGSFHTAGDIISNRC